MTFDLDGNMCHMICCIGQCGFNGTGLVGIRDLDYDAIGVHVLTGCTYLCCAYPSILFVVVLILK